MTTIEKQKILVAMYAALQKMPDGTRITTAVLYFRLFPGQGRNFDDRDLYDLHFDLLQEALSHGLLLDMSHHYGRIEGLPYNLDFEVHHKRI